MGSSLIGIGITSLNAAQAGLTTTSHNISNASTPGFSRQATVQTTPSPQFSGAGFLGRGVLVETVRRSYSSFLDAQLREATAQAAHLDRYHEQISQIDNLLADSATGLTPALSDFFAGVNTTAANPGDPSARQVLLSAGQSMAGRFRDLAGRLDQMRQSTNVETAATVTDINSQASQIAQLNDKIRFALGSGQTPNDLLDQRDAVLHDLAGNIRINVIPLADGTLNVFLPNGQALVAATQSMALSAAADPGNPASITVGIGVGSAFVPLRESDLTGGKLGGMLAFRAQVLDGAENALGRVAATLGASFNAQHAVGQDRQGALGGAFFSFDPASVTEHANNTGNAVITASVSNYAAVGTSDYRLRYDGTNYLVTRLADNTTQSFASLPQTVDGVTVSLGSGAAAAGDSFLIRPVHDAARNFSALISDPALVAAAQPVRSSGAAANSGSASMRVTVVTPPVSANLLQPVTITFTSAGTFDVGGTGTGNPAGLTFSNGLTISYNGWSAKLEGAPSPGDVFTIAPNTGGTGDNGNMLALGALQSMKMIASGSTTLNEAYAQLVGRTGSMTHAASMDQQAQKAILSQASAAQQAVAGVNLDEEAANLLRYQQAYQASGKVIAAANAVFEEILSILR